jgi:hypothetical protein
MRFERFSRHTASYWVFLPYKRIVKITEKARLFEFEDGKKWLPKQVCRFYKYRPNQVGIPIWFAKAYKLTKKDSYNFKNSYDSHEKITENTA